MTTDPGQGSLRERIAKAICWKMNGDECTIQCAREQKCSGAWVDHCELLPVADSAVAEFSTFLRERSARKQARALDVEQTIAEMTGSPS